MFLDWGGKIIWIKTYTQSELKKNKLEQVALKPWLANLTLLMKSPSVQTKNDLEKKHSTPYLDLRK